MQPMPGDGTRAFDASPPGRGAATVGSIWRGLRVRDWAHFLVLPLASAPLAALDADAVVGLARGVVIATLVLAYGYLLNGLADRTLDRDATKNPFALASTQTLDRLTVLSLMLAVTAVALASAGGLVPLLATSTSVLAGWLYSTGPRLKRFPVVGTLLNVACFAPLLFVGTSRTPPPVASLLALAFTGLLLENQLLHEAADGRDDAAGAVRTTFLAIGPRAAAAFAALAGLLPVTAIASASPDEFGALVAGATALVVVVFVPRTLLRFGVDPRRMARARLLHRLASVVVGALLFALANLRA